MFSSHLDNLIFFELFSTALTFLPNGARRAVQGAEIVAGGIAVSGRQSHRNWRGTTT
jgi:hypothetical protein